MPRDPGHALTIAALIVAVVSGAAVPAIFLQRELASLEAHMESAVQVQSAVLSRLVNRDPGGWRYQENLLNEMLALHHAHSRDDRHEAVRIVDAEGATIVGHGPALPAPTTTRRAPLYDSGAVVANVEDIRSLRPLLAETVLVVLAGLLLGIGVFAAFRRVPLRIVASALEEARGAARRAEHELKERTAAEAALAQSREHLQHLLALSPAIIYAVNPRGHVTFISDNIREQLGYEPAELLGDPDFWPTNLHPDDRNRMLALKSRLPEDGRGSAEYRFRHKDGTWRWMHDTTVLVRDATGAPQELIGAWLDISRRRRAEERLRLAVEGSGVALWDADAATGEVYLSERWAEMRGAPSAETRTTVRELAALTHPEEGRRLIDAALLVAKGVREAYREEHRVRTVSGEWRWVLSQGKVTERDPASGRALRMTGTNLDITERRRAQAALEETLRLQTEFMNNVTHELRSPLNSVIGFAELLKDGVPGPLNARQQDFVGDIHASGLQLLKLVEGVLEMSRLGAAGFALAPEPLEVGAALAECVAAHRAAAEAKRVSIALEVVPGTGSAQLDPRALRRILDALLDNAVKFNRDGGSVAVSARRTGGTLEIAVADTGIGFAPEDRAKLFQPLVQLDASIARRHGGIGLGLALAHRLAALAGGTLEVEGEPGRGSTFTLRLPVENSP